MPVLVQWLLGGLAWTLTNAVGKILVTMGLTFVLVNFVMDDWLNVIAGKFAGAPGFVLAMASFYRIDDVITILLSAIAVRVGSGMLKGVKRGAVAAS